MSIDETSRIQRKTCPTPSDMEELSAARWKAKYLLERRHSKHWEQLCKKNLRILKSIERLLDQMSEMNERN